MGIERGGDAEYEEFEPSYEEKTEKLEATLKPFKTSAGGKPGFAKTFRKIYSHG